MDYRKLFGFNELKDLNFWRAVLGELIVTALFIVIVCGSTVQLPSEDKPTRLHVSLAHAFTVAVLASAFSDISGGNFNPAVSLALTILGEISITRCFVYVVMQCAGSIAGGALLYFFTPKSSRDAGSLGSLAIHSEIEPGVAFLIEVVLTYQFIFVVVSSTDPSRKMTGFQAPLAIGLSVGVALLMGIPYTGASLNPIRALGPGVVMSKLDNHWVYWAGPIVGAILASITYKYIFKLKPTSSEVDPQAKPEVFENIALEMRVKR